MVEKHAATEVGVRTGTRPPERSPMARLAAGVGAALVVGGLAFLIVCLLADHRVVLVNGLPKPYTVQIGGHKYELGPYAHLQISLGSGEYSLGGQGESVSIPEQRIEVRHPFLPSGKRCVVINPDQVALLTWQGQKYVEKYLGRDSAGQDFRRLFGRPVYDLQQVDYLFQPLPGRVPATSAGAQWKWSLTHDACASDAEWCKKVRFEYRQDPKAAAALRQASDPQFKWVDAF